ncbi:hypothetical protein ACIA5C_08530 [Actinoplanes sp. NPDC051343]|uniref:hypothetical protein n=1 Tax=Actinoplanes sp. NPDC051343 TaxID=3363906 RepID=UPI0037A715F3
MPVFTPQVLADPVKVIVDLVTGTDPLLDPTEVQQVAEATAAAQARAGTARQAVAAHRRAFARSARGRRSAHRAAPGRFHRGVGAGLRRVRQTVTHPATPW